LGGRLTPLLPLICHETAAETLCNFFQQCAIARIVKNRLGGDKIKRESVWCDKMLKTGVVDDLELWDFYS
jgi:hypothetical protein